MGFPSVTYTFANSTTADATQVNQNFTDIINGVSDGTKNINISALTAGSTSNLQGSVTLGASTANILTINCALGTSIPIQTTNTYDIGADATGLRSIYFGSGSSAHSTRLIGASVSSAWTMTLPTTAGTAGYVLATDGSGVTSWVVFQRSATDAQNVGITASVGSNQLTIGVVDSAGSALGGGDLANIVFRNSTAATGQVANLAVSSVSSLVVPSGATLGQTSGMDQYVWVYLLNNAGTAELAVSGINVFDDGSIQNTTAITSGSTSGSTLYSTSNRSNVPIRRIGRLKVNEAAAGTWASAPTEIALNPVVVPTMTDWVADTSIFTAAFLGTLTNNNVFKKRVGDYLWVKATFTTGTHTGASAAFILGESLTIDTTKMSTSTNLEVVGDLWVQQSASTGIQSGVGPFVLFYDGSTNNKIWIATASASNQFTKLLGTDLTNNFIYTISFRVPIAGWSNFGP